MLFHSYILQCFSQNIYIISQLSCCNIRRWTLRHGVEKIRGKGEEGQWKEKWGKKEMEGICQNLHNPEMLDWG